jgi:Tol biopolymer transport system component
MGLLVKRVSEAPRTPRSLEPKLSARFEEAILGCLERAPESRLATAYDVIGALSGVTADRVRDWTGPVPILPSTIVRAKWGAGSRWLLPAGLAAIGLAVALVWWARGSKIGGQTSRPLVPMQLTTAPGLELDPAFSPDGKSLVYSGDESHAFELYVQNLAPGGGKSQLTFGGTQAFEPAWSPDGRWVAYHAAAAGGIWRVPAGGGGSERLASFGSRPAFAPDGRTIVFQSESLPTLADTSAPALARSRLWLVDLDGGEPRPLTQVGHPAGGHAAPSWSPGGQRIAFTASQRDSSEIWSIDPRGADLVPLVREPATAFDPVFSPDGSAVYFSARVRQVSGLWRVPVSRRSGEALGPPVQIANIGLASIRQLAIGPASVAAYAALATTSNLWSLPVDADGVPTGPPRALTMGSGRNNRAVFSPDGRRLAYDRWRLGVNIDLWVMELATGTSRQITTDPFSNGQASWLPDDDSLLFHSTRAGRRGLWEVDLATASVRSSVELEDDVDWARLSPDGSRIAYHARSGGSVVNIWVRSREGGVPVRLTGAAELAGFPVWSPDGQYLAYQLKQAEDSHVMVVHADGGEPRQLTSGAGQSWPFGFSPDGDKVVFAGYRSREWNLWWVSRTSGEARRLTDLGKLGTYVRYPRWSPSGGQIVFELAETVGDVWILEALQ